MVLGLYSSETRWCWDYVSLGLYSSETRWCWDYVSLGLYSSETRVVLGLRKPGTI